MARAKKKKIPRPATIRGQGVPPILGTELREEFDRFDLGSYTWHGHAHVIEWVRECTGLDQRELGGMLGGYSRSQIARYESAEADPPIAFWVQFTKATSLSLTWVFTGLGYPYVHALQDLTEYDNLARWCIVAEERQKLRHERVDEPVYLVPPGEPGEGQRIDRARVEASLRELEGKGQGIMRKRPTKRSKDQSP